MLGVEVLRFGRAELRNDRLQQEEIAESVGLQPDEMREKGSKLAASRRDLAGCFSGGTRERAESLFARFGAMAGAVDDQAQ